MKHLNEFESSEPRDIIEDHKVLDEFFDTSMKFNALYKRSVSSYDKYFLRSGIWINDNKEKMIEALDSLKASIDAAKEVVTKAKAIE